MEKNLSPGSYTGPAGTAQVLVVDDEETICRMLSSVLRQDFRLATAETAEEALDFLAREPADVVLVDKNLPGKTGIDLLREIKQIAPDIEVIIITGYASLDSAIESLRLGAYDYLTKPFDDISIVLQKVARAAEKKELQQEHRKLIDQLVASNQELRSAHDRLRRGYLETLSSMITALEARDSYTRGHSDRVAEIAVQVGRGLGLTPEALEILRDGALLHDIGKIGVHEGVLNKQGALTEEEFAHIKTHPEVGSEILGKMESYHHLLPMIRHHHERWDGSGYPDGLRGEDTPIEARVIAVADCFDAMTSQRTYRRPLSPAEACAVIEGLSGTQLDPAVVYAFIEVLKANGVKITGT